MALPSNAHSQGTGASPLFGGGWTYFKERGGHGGEKRRCAVMGASLIGLPPGDEHNSLGSCAEDSGVTFGVGQKEAPDTGECRGFGFRLGGTMTGEGSPVGD